MSTLWRQTFFNEWSMTSKDIQGHIRPLCFSRKKRKSERTIISSYKKMILWSFIHSYFLHEKIKRLDLGWVSGSCPQGSRMTLLHTILSSISDFSDPVVSTPVSINRMSRKSTITLLYKSLFVYILDLIILIILTTAHPTIFQTPNHKIKKQSIIILTILILILTIKKQKTS